MNIIEGIQQECNRLRAICPSYEQLGPVGAFGLAMIKQDIAKGEAAIASDDVVRMVTTLAYLKEQDPS